ncbi:MAG: hypothetical protein SFW67_36095 [Myxococcaceae bacterium]|nr:hypothetical protein [Myxococcaceae bacterium]
MSRIAKADVNAALTLAAKRILEAGGSDGRVSRAEMKKALTALPKEERKLADLFFRFVDHRDFKAGAQVTKTDLDRAVAYAKKTMIAKYDLNNDGLSKAEISKMSLTGKLAVDLAKTLKAAGTNPSGGAGRVSDRVATAAVEKALPVGDEPVRGLSKEVKLSEIPQPARDAIRKAGEAYANKSFGGTDFSADVNGYFAVYTSATDKTVVAYAMTGSGSGEPDYSEATVVAVNLAGKTIVDETTDW